MADIIYNIAKQQIFNGAIDLDGDTFRVALLESSTNQAVTHETVAAVLAADDELTGTAGVRQELDTPAVRISVPNSRAEWYDSVDAHVEWAAVSRTAAEECIGFLVYQFGTGDADSVPILMVDSIANIVPNGSNIRITWNAAGIMHSG